MTQQELKISDWLALMIGNSRLHWAHFQGQTIKETRDTPHYPITSSPPYPYPLYIASVVPSQTDIWKTYPHVTLFTLEQIPLRGVYPTMGIDRALAVWGMGCTHGFPCLVIDAGTALTFTGVNRDRVLIGGAILPGLKLQLQSLSQKTAALPDISLSETLPPRWADNTPEAIKSGVIYSILAGISTFIQDWLTRFPDSQIGLTGGDSSQIFCYLQAQYPEITERIIVAPNLIFWGMRSALDRSPTS